MEPEKILIRMLKTVKPDIPFLAKADTIASAGNEYFCITNKFGAISVICANGECLGVRPGEFEFVEAPEWLLSIHNNL